LYVAHGGRAYARNIGVAAARADLIAWQDADEVALPERLASQLAWMRRHSLDICGASAKTFGGQDGYMWCPETHQAIQYELLFRLAMLQATVLMRTEVARANPYAEQSSFEDYEMWTRLATLYRMGNVPQILIKHRAHPNQSHVVESAGFQSDSVKYSQRLFMTLFPEATDEDCAAIADAVQQRPAPTLARLEHTGQWLARLAQTPDNFQRRKMADRWRAACQRSGHLGLASYHLYRRLAPAFGTDIERNLTPLWLICALRLRSDSRAYAKLAAMKRKASATLRNGPGRPKIVR
jgi:glycosyltransferase involved in cell wall biosynthesis